MRKIRFVPFLFTGLWILATLAAAADFASVDFFSPEGTVKGVRQIAARFSEAMVAFGDPRLEDPFEVSCPEPGTGRWADPRNWIYDFERDLPAGVRCTFLLKENFKPLSGRPLAGRKEFSFSTGGPAVIQVLPHEGSHEVDEEQIFLLGLDAPASEASILENAYFTATGIEERIGVRLLKGDERRRVLDLRRDFIERYFQVLFKRRTGQPIGTAVLRERGTRQEQLIKARDGGDSPLVVLQSRQRFPNESEVKLVWGMGIASLSGVVTDAEQKLAFKTRPEFRARFTCSRLNKDADCIPLLPMSLDFTAPVSRAAAERIRMIDLNGKDYRPEPAKAPEGREPFVERVTFKGPFPELARFRMELPEVLKDDAGRPLANARSFPLKVFTDEDPPLAKFAARFGIIELKAGALLPVTLRNIEASLKAAQFKMETAAAVPGRTLRLDAAAGPQVVSWLRRLKDAERLESDSPLKGRSLFGAGDGPLQTIEVPRALSGREFEVVGIPLNGAGFYVVELASTRLGSALLGEKRPYHVSAGALVTNLAVHFKLGRESSLIWVTRLDDGLPAAGAEVAVSDCRGKVYWGGKTDDQGLAQIRQALPAARELPGCFGCCDGQYVVTASSGEDSSFTLSGWQEGISPWRFNLQRAEYLGPYVATTVFDRTLLRAGETVHMKHMIREHTGQGFRFVAAERLEKKVVLRHEGSEDRFEIPVAWDSRGTTESQWEIPKEAKQGTYRVFFVDRLEPQRGGARDRERPAGEFRVEAFRVPLMKAALLPPKEPLVNAAEVSIGVQVNYLSGGGAAHAPVKLRSLLQAKTVTFPDYPEYIFANGGVKEGIEPEGRELWRIDEYTVEEEDEETRPRAWGEKTRSLGTLSLALDRGGAGRAEIRKLPKVETPHEVIAELEYHDPNGEILTASARVPLWPARVVLAVKPDSWALSRDNFKYQILALDLAGKPVPGLEIKTDLLQRTTYSHRKRLVGGFYAYESTTEVKRVADGCSGKTDSRGLLSCEQKSPASGELIIRAGAEDEAGNPAAAHQSAWVMGSEDWWFDVKDGDRMDLLPERKRYEPGEQARLQVRMPFRRANALVTLEREGILESRVVELSGKAPVVEIPISGHQAPNIFVSVLAIRGRVAGVQPTALIDLGKPAFRLGYAELKVGWQAHELKVEVRPEKSVYQVREKAKVRVNVRLPDGGLPPRGAEVVLAAVDEGLLELRPNDSWNLLEAMMRRRGIEVETSTAQTQVVGKRHFGRKAVVHGGGGGRQGARELFETLLFWKGRLKLNEQGLAEAEIPLNDSLTAFRIVAVAEGGPGKFGTGQATIRATQDFMILAGLPPLIRERDRFRAIFTVRNTTERPAEMQLSGRLSQSPSPGRPPLVPLAVQNVALAAGEAMEVGWEVAVPANAESLEWEVALSSRDGLVRDRLKAVQRVVPAVPVRTFQAALTQLDRPLSISVERPSDATPGRGGVKVHLQNHLAGELAGVKEYISFYPYICLEQLVSQAVALRDAGRWRRVMARLSGYLDRDGLAKYFPSMLQGSDVLTSYILSLAEEAGWTIPEDSRSRMTQGLRDFVQGRVIRNSDLPTADVAIRKIAALDALIRTEGDVEAKMLASIAIEPNLWPTSAVLDWISLLSRKAHLPDRDNRLAQAEQIIRSRLNFQGTVMGFSTERTDALWWLMISGDVNANRAVLNLLTREQWQEDLPRLARGALARQQKGRWNTTVANAWGVLAMEKFSGRFEKGPVAGKTALAIGPRRQEHNWAEKEKGGTYDFPWPQGPGTVEMNHGGEGKPWATIQSLAAIPLKQAFSSGYRIGRTIAPVEQKIKNAWSRGDIYRVRLEIEAQSDMTWVVVNDPIPAGAAILGTGLGRGSKILSQEEKKLGWVWPAFEERRLDSFRAYYRLVPKGRFTAEYTVRLNNPGRFELPETRVEALYSPEMFGEAPNEPLEVKP